MNQAVRSIYVYVIYLIGLAGTLLLMPNIPLRIVGLPETQEVWIRIVGMTVLILAIYYYMAARNKVRETLVLSVPIRLAVPLIFAGFIVADLSPWNLILLTPGDVLFALWTWVALRRSPAPA